MVKQSTLMLSTQRQGNRQKARGMTLTKKYGQI